MFFSTAMRQKRFKESLRGNRRFMLSLCPYRDRGAMTVADKKKRAATGNVEAEATRVLEGPSLSRPPSGQRRVPHQVMSPSEGLGWSRPAAPGARGGPMGTRRYRATTPSGTSQRTNTSWRWSN